MSVTDGRGVHLAFDAGGAATLPSTFKGLARGGTVVSFGPPPAIDQSNPLQLSDLFNESREDDMNTRQLLLVGMSVLVSAACGPAGAQEMQGQYVQIAEIEIDPLQLEDYKAAVKEHIETAIRVEPGVLVLYSVSEKDNPTQIRVFEIYASPEAYRAHLEAPHFKKYKLVTEKMVKSLRLVQTTPVILGAKTR